MKRLCVMITALVVVGCSDAYRDLASAYGTDKGSSAPPLAASSIVITSQTRGGATSYHGVAKIRASADSVDVDIEIPFMQSLKIPTREIAACAMTCFGTSAPNVDLLIPRTGTDLMIPGKELLEWCWTNRKPMISGAAKRSWNYGRAALPPIDSFREQLASRQAFDQQTKLTCLGY